MYALTKVFQNTRGKYGLIRKGDKSTIIIGDFKNIMSTL